jgi:isopentenyl diphosphate isomerase/L-lactate dehydrogenase-like FMN-dependent dehydrogenase
MDRRAHCISDPLSAMGMRPQTRFDDIIIRPHFLINDVSAVDTSTTLFGKRLTQPIYISVTGGNDN